MKITILCTSDQHPVNSWLNKWIEDNENNHEISFIREKCDLVGGDILFLISCSEIIGVNERNKFTHSLVLHASDLPEGRGWSPHIWSIIQGDDAITVTLLEADDKIDTGDIWEKIRVRIPATALYDEINNLVFAAEMELMTYAVDNYLSVQPAPQNLQITSQYWPRRHPADSEIDIDKSISEQFNLIRVCDPGRFPAFFVKDGKKFKIKIELFDE